MNQTTLPLAAALIGGAISLVGTWATCRVSRRIGFVDHPGGHKGHADPVALGGGIAIAAAVALPMLAVVIFARFGGADLLPAAGRIHLGGIITKTPLALGIIAAIVVMCGMGLWDDRRPLRPLPKLLVQIIVATGLVFVYDLRLLSHLGWTASSALSILWILTLMNSLNFLDNMDGLARARLVRHGGSTTAGFAETFEFEVQPREFTRLRTGGPANGWMVDGILFQNGRMFQASGRTWLETSFRQKS